MEKKLLIFVIAGALVFSACEKQLLESEDVSGKKSVQLLEDQNVHSKKKGQVVLNFRTHLSGDQEVPPRETSATGQAIFQLSKDGEELRYKLIVANLNNLRMAHIHVAPAGANGGFVAWLYPPAPPAILKPGTTNGVLQEGVIRKANLVGLLAGKEVSDLVDLIIADSTYVNVHTQLYGGGEIRGQIFGNVKGN